jgi:hypothetical protein
MYIVDRPGSENGNSGSEVSMRNLGILWVLSGLLRFVGALGVFLYNGTLTVMWGALLTGGSESVYLDGPLSCLSDLRYCSRHRCRRCFHHRRPDFDVRRTIRAKAWPARGLVRANQWALGIALGAYALVVLVRANADIS